MPSSDHQLISSSLDQMRSLLADDKHLKHVTLDDDILVKFLNARNNDPKSAVKQLKNYFHFRRTRPDYFMTMSEVYSKFEVRLFMAYDATGTDGEPIVYIKPSLWQPEKWSLDMTFASIIPFSELAVQDRDSIAQKVGFTILIDMRDFSWSMLAKLR